MRHAWLVAAATPVETRIDRSLSAVGVLLVLVTLFTQAQEAALEHQLEREGGAQPGARQRLLIYCSALALVTVLAFLAMTGTALAAVAEVLRDPGQGPAALFGLIWLLLLPLVVWQISIARRARRLG